MMVDRQTGYRILVYALPLTMPSLPSKGDYARRVIGLVLLAATPLGSFAQTASPSNPPKSDEAPSESVPLSAFEVTSTQGRGYVTTNSASGFKTNEPFINIPQSILVVTRDLI